MTSDTAQNPRGGRSTNGAETQAGQARPPDGVSLTAQETRVAEVIVRGLSNREAAAALFLSPKTIEMHLGNVYRKLGVRSRTQLARRLTHETGTR